MMDQEKTGRFIAEKRKEKGMTQKELAEQLGIGNKAVSKWECGRGMPDNSIMLPLCSFLGISVNELLMGESLSEKDYKESSKDIILTLMEEKESLKKKNKKSLFSCVLAILCAVVLFFLIFMYIRGWNSWVYFFDPLTIVIDLIIVLIILLVTGSVKAFFQSFLLIHKEDADEGRLFSSLQAIKLAIASSLLGGGMFTLLYMIFILGTTADIMGNGMSVTLLPVFYGTLFSLFLLPVRYKLESKVGGMHEKSD